MAENKWYLVNIVGTCRNCIVDLTKEQWNPCFWCDVLMCPTHYRASHSCDLCKYIPDDSIVCTICDCPTDLSVECGIYCEDMAFSDSRVSDVTDVYICVDCNARFIKPYVYPNTNVYYQTVTYIYDKQAEWIRPTYDVFRAGNELNYKLIQDGRDKILEHYKKTIPIFILPDIANIIIEYCGFARDIVFEEV
jgi:hypothetical protein